MEVNERLDRLEKQNRRLMVMAYGFPALVGVVMLLGAGDERDGNLPTGKFSTIYCDDLTVGSRGGPNINLHADKDGAGLTILDATLEIRTMLNFNSETGSYFDLDSASGANIMMRTKDKDGDGTRRGDAVMVLRSPGDNKASITILASEAECAGAVMMKSPKTGKWSRVGYNKNGAFSDNNAPKAVGDDAKDIPDDAEKPTAERDKADGDKKAKAAADAVTEKLEAEQNERVAVAKLRTAEAFLKSGNRAAYRGTLKELVEKYPNTKAAEKARKALK